MKLYHLPEGANRDLALELLTEMLERQKQGQRIKTMRSLKRRLTEALNVDHWPGIGPVKCMLGLSDYCSPSEAGVDFHVSGGDADLFHYQQIADKLTTDD